MSSLHALTAVAREQSGARDASREVVGADGVTDPQIIGRYALFDQIAAGGMGVVHLGRLMGAAGFERVVAMKRTHRLLAGDPEFVAMFCEEVRLLGRIRHPNVVTALDVVDDDGELVLVMEYVHGESLGGLMRRAREQGTRVPIGVAVSIACGVLRGLHAAHIARSADGQPLEIVHRDVSPHNLLLGCDGSARVLDFGVAKARDSLAVTQVGQVKGRLSYMAPEQIRGASIDHRVDIYGLSVVLWELLAHRSLFPGRDTEVIEKVLQGAIPSLTDAPESEVSSELERVVLRGLANEPCDRFATALEMAGALEAALSPASLDANASWLAVVAGDVLEARARLVAHAETHPLPPSAPSDAPRVPDASALLEPDWDDATVVDVVLPSDSVTALVALPQDEAEPFGTFTRRHCATASEPVAPLAAESVAAEPLGVPAPAVTRRGPSYRLLIAAALVCAVGAAFCWRMATRSPAQAAVPSSALVAARLPPPPLPPTVADSRAPALAIELPAPPAAAAPSAEPAPRATPAPRRAPRPSVKPVRGRPVDSRSRSVDGF